MQKTYTCTAAQFASLRSQLVAEGITVPEGNGGIIDSGTGFKMQFYFLPDSQTLQLQILDKTCWLPTASQIWDQMQSHLNS